MDNLLGRLTDPDAFQQPLEVSTEDHGELERMLRMMLLIRAAEEKIGDEVSSGAVKCPCHLGIGQEAVATGIAESLTGSDRVFGAHRSHSHYLSLGGSVRRLFAEVLGKQTGCSRGMGGSMHLHDGEKGFLGAVPIVAATIPIATGAALAAKMDGGTDIAVSYFGDGAAEEGVFHESLNLAAAMGLPVLFVCENNLFASHLHIGIRQPADSIARFATSHAMDSAVIDGNDVIAVKNKAAAAITAMRRERRPFLLEAVTYRWRGHVGPGEDIDVGVKRSESLTRWKQRDPIARLAKGMVGAGFIDAERLAALEKCVHDEIEVAWTEAWNDPYPMITALVDRVFYHRDGEA